MGHAIDTGTYVASSPAGLKETVSAVAPTNPAIGDIWIDPSDNPSAPVAGTAMGGDLTGTYPNPTIAAAKVTNTALNASAIALFDAAGAAAATTRCLLSSVAEIISPVDTNENAIRTLTIPAGTFTAGRILRLEAEGNIDSIATSGILTFRLRLGGIAGALLFSAAFSSQAGAGTNKVWELRSRVSCRTPGAAGTSAIVSTSFLRADFGGSTQQTIGGNLAAFSSVDTTVNEDLVLTCQWATANAGNLVRSETASLEQVV